MTPEVKDLLNRLLRSIDYERDEERERHLEEMKKLSGKAREYKGRAIVELKKKKIGRSLGGDYLYLFRKQRGGYLPDTEIGNGDQVIISQYDPLDVENPKGTVYEMSNTSITIAMSSQLSMSNTRPIRIDLFVNDITYMRMETALSNAKSHQYSRLHALLSGFYNANTKPFDYENNELNQMQVQGIRLALGNNGYYSIQGPPGTGKTYTAGYLIQRMVQTNHRVLITADSNAAVDNMIRKLVELGENPLRIGNPIRVNQDLKEYTLDYKVMQHALFNEIETIESKIDMEKEAQKHLDKPSMKYTRGLTHKEIMELIEKRQSARGIPKQALKEMKPWVKSQLTIDDLYDKLKEVRDEIRSQLISSHNIIATTNSTAGSELLLYDHFDWVIIDEAAQASIPSSLIPILKGERFVLLGDHFQLPPVVLNREAKELGLAESLMDYLAKKYPYQMTMLTVQYRMHQKINDLVSQLFYDGLVEPHNSVAHRKLDFGKKVIECIHVEGDEQMQSDSKSYFNELEMSKVEKTIERLMAKGLTEDQIAVISPYKAQATQLRKRLLNRFEIDTVDAFQGREKDVVILSFVRSNEDERIGFLKDYRRLNVSISRAKKKLIMIGNFKTLKTDRLFREMLELVEVIEG
ncbi:MULTISPECIES: IGHMBP2 family helicase [unclassified Fusibacter]|uniref:IGHMBP2 family helicase n=1 Tax=unclassified Fusibacter TaxID=2624464 RepID=UPI0010130347|nr:MULTISPECIES: IGHMBP2 family helicase [unclassified Fusibacter]MCK8058675.1 IGHMBP2 family helicase [Fusibacter sp. A2]NPE21750.1 IGHMBP2 family helicase [Fusibacter sp. A1]RXV61324.1 IGHMBP2 family helicase [Fusibacter sp. A1]